jgi:hypothetical protein
MLITIHSHSFHLYHLLYPNRKPHSLNSRSFTPIVSNNNFVWPGTHLEGQQQ